MRVTALVVLVTVVLLATSARTARAFETIVASYSEEGEVPFILPVRDTFAYLIYGDEEGGEFGSYESRIVVLADGTLPTLVDTVTDVREAVVTEDADYFVYVSGSVNSWYPFDGDGVLALDPTLQSVSPRTKSPMATRGDVLLLFNNVNNLQVWTSFSGVGGTDDATFVNIDLEDTCDLTGPIAFDAIRITPDGTKAVLVRDNTDEGDVWLAIVTLGEVPTCITSASPATPPTNVVLQTVVTDTRIVVAEVALSATTVRTYDIADATFVEEREFVITTGVIAPYSNIAFFLSNAENSVRLVQADDLTMSSAYITSPLENVLALRIVAPDVLLLAGPSEIAIVDVSGIEVVWEGVSGPDPDPEVDEEGGAGAGAHMTSSDLTYPAYVVISAAGALGVVMVVVGAMFGAFSP